MKTNYLPKIKVNLNGKSKVLEVSLTLEQAQVLYEQLDTILNKVSKPEYAPSDQIHKWKNEPWYEGVYDL